MEMKIYQKKAIGDLTRFLELVNATPSIAAAYKAYWEEQGVPVGFLGMSAYNNIISGVPHVCFKVPTGGGKTYLACNAIKPVFEALPFTKTKAVAWLAPSDAIMEQTIKNLRDVNHPYRQRIDIDFSSRVEVYTKEQLLNGQNFNPTSVNEQLSIFVLSYDSFRSSRKDGRKAYQENGYLASFAKVYGAPEQPVEGADETALIQVINRLSPLVIVDESHHAQSELSVEMLKNFNPCFVLDLTATPKANSNIISFVDALQLKKENMVKLPVIVYNRRNQMDVLIEAIDLRRKLEEDASREQEQTGRYIRPIVLFQAQPKNKDDSTTFEKLKQKIVEFGIPADEIAIKTAEINDLKNVNLMREDCEIRYIITVNALKEGWDCPFAYVLATLANKTSAVDVEQILGRILRQPHTRQHVNKVLNMSYVLTCSDDFMATLDRIVEGLNDAGFSKQDYRVAELETDASEPPVGIPGGTTQGLLNLGLPPEAEDEIVNINTEEAKAILRARETQQGYGQTSGPALPVNDMLDAAIRQNDRYESEIMSSDSEDAVAAEVREKMNKISINEEFRAEAVALELPQFYIEQPGGLFSDGTYQELSREHLADGFTLKDKDIVINFDNVDSEIVKVDVEGSGKDLAPKYRRLDGSDSKYFKEYFSALPQESKLKACKEMIAQRLSKLDAVADSELRPYVERVVDNLSGDHLAALENAPYSYAEKIKKKIEALLTVYCEKQFELRIEQGTIVCRGGWKFKTEITPLNTVSSIAKSLYSAEADMNGFEKEMALALTSMSNVRWWHRNIEKTGFCVNGYINHYPDFIVMTATGKIVVIETKGDHLKNDENLQKLKLGRIWQNKGGAKYRYYMVFQDKIAGLDGAYAFDAFMGLIKGL